MTDTGTEANLSGSTPTVNAGAAAGDPALDGIGYGSMSVAAILSETAQRMPDRAAVRWAGETVSYSELWRQTRAYAGALRVRGVGPGDRVAVLIPNVPDFPGVYYAILSLGAAHPPSVQGRGDRIRPRRQRCNTPRRGRTVSR